MRNSSSPHCQHFPLGALTNLRALEGGRGKDWVPGAGLLRFNKCHCGALCQLHKQATICVPCILVLLGLQVGKQCGRFFFPFIFCLFRKGPLIAHLSLRSHCYIRECPVHYCLPKRKYTAGKAEFPSESFFYTFPKKYGCQKRGLSDFLGYSNGF